MKIIIITCSCFFLSKFILMIFCKTTVVNSTLVAIFYQGQQNLEKDDFHNLKKICQKALSFYAIEIKLAHVT